MTTTSAAGLQVGRWTVDPTCSTANFQAHSLGRTVIGTVPIIDGTIDIDDNGQPAAISGSLDIGAVDTGNARRDKDLRKPRFLDLDRYPTMTFAADTMIGTPDGWRVTGHLTVRGTSIRPARDAAVSRHGDSATVSTRTRLDRRALGIRALRIMMGHAIDVTVTATLRLTTTTTTTTQQ